MHIRNEKPRDYEGVRAVNLAAFETGSEAELVDRLREEADPVISLVAEEGDGIVGHILFSPVTVEGHPELRMMGLAPMAVLPKFQGNGIGSRLIETGIKACIDSRAEAVAVLGHPQYYPKFQFIPAESFGLTCEYDVPREVFLIRELQDGRLDTVSGMVRYHILFNELD